MGRLFFDNTPPDIVGKYPVSNAFINLAEISYSTNEDLSQGVLSWNPIDGSQGIEIDLISNELNIGTFGIGVVNQQLDLTDGIKYDIEIKAIDGNSERLVSENGFQDNINAVFDITSMD